MSLPVASMPCDLPPWLWGNVPSAATDHSCPSVSVGDWFQEPLRIPKSVDAQVPYIKWCNTVSVGTEDQLYFVSHLLLKSDSGLLQKLPCCLHRSFWWWWDLCWQTQPLLLLFSKKQVWVDPRLVCLSAVPPWTPVMTSVFVSVISKILLPRGVVVKTEIYVAEGDIVCEHAYRLTNASFTIIIRFWFKCLTWTHLGGVSRRANNYQTLVLWLWPAPGPSQQADKVDTIIIPMSIEKLWDSSRFRARKKQSCGWNLGSLVVEPVLLSTQLYCPKPNKWLRTCFSLKMPWSPECSWRGYPWPGIATHC